MLAIPLTLTLKLAAAPEQSQPPRNSEPFYLDPMPGPKAQVKSSPFSSPTPDSDVPSFLGIQLQNASVPLFAYTDCYLALRLEKYLPVSF